MPAAEEADQAGILRVVIIHPDDIHRVGHHVELVEILPLHDVVNHRGRIGEVVAAPVGQGIDAHDDGAGPFAADDLRRIAEHVGGSAQSPFVGERLQEESGRPVPGDPAEIERAVRFVLRHEDADVGLHGPHHAGDLRAPRFLHIGMEEIDPPLVLFVIKPIRESEVPQSDHRLDARGAQLPRHLDIAGQCLFVDHPGPGFDPGPLHPEAEVRDAELFDRPEVEVEAGPRRHGLIAPGRSAPFLGEDVPVGAEIHRVVRGHTAILVLETRGRGAPPEFFLGQRLQDHRPGGTLVGSGRGDATGQCRQRDNKKKSGCLHHGEQISNLVA